jgi:hypothetical protein
MSAAAPAIQSPHYELFRLLQERYTVVLDKDGKLWHISDCATYNPCKRRLRIMLPPTNGVQQFKDIDDPKRLCNAIAMEIASAKHAKEQHEQQVRSGLPVKPPLKAS